MAEYWNAIGLVLSTITGFAVGHSVVTQVLNNREKGYTVYGSDVYKFTRYNRVEFINLLRTKNPLWYVTISLFIATLIVSGYVQDFNIVLVTVRSSVDAITIYTIVIAIKTFYIMPKLERLLICMSTINEIKRKSGRVKRIKTIKDGLLFKLEKCNLVFYYYGDEYVGDGCEVEVEFLDVDMTVKCLVKKLVPKGMKRDDCGEQSTAG